MNGYIVVFMVYAAINAFCYLLPLIIDASITQKCDRSPRRWLLIASFVSSFVVLALIWVYWQTGAGLGLMLIATCVTPMLGGMIYWLDVCDRYKNQVCAVSEQPEPATKQNESDFVRQMVVIKERRA